MNICCVAKTIRASKIIILFMVALMALFTVFGNIADYHANFRYVTNVLSMQTTMADGTLMFRGIENTAVHHLAFIIIIIWEALIMILCFMGVVDMMKNFHGTADQFHNSKKYGIWGLIACGLLWFFGFQVIASEWFAMWMNPWNGLPDAMRLVLYTFLTLIFLTMKNDE